MYITHNDDIPDVKVVKEDGALERVVEPLDQLDAGRLAATRRSHQGNCLSFHIKKVLIIRSVTSL